MKTTIDTDGPYFNNPQPYKMFSRVTNSSRYKPYDYGNYKMTKNEERVILVSQHIQGCEKFKNIGFFLKHENDSLIIIGTPEVRDKTYWVAADTTKRAGRQNSAKGGVSIAIQVNDKGNYQEILFSLKEKVSTKEVFKFYKIENKASSLTKTKQIDLLIAEKKSCFL